MEKTIKTVVKIEIDRENMSLSGFLENMLVL